MLEIIAPPKEAQKYSQLKERLARECPKNIDGYIKGKDNFINSIDEKAKDWR
ncbi:MAG: GrpB family protein [Promethearchaeota archaeon]